MAPSARARAIGDPMGPVNVDADHAVHAHDQLRTRRPTPTALVSRATGPTQPPTVPGAPAPMPGVFNQNITGTQAGTNWNQALNVWTTPWGFLKGAAANNATVRQQGGQQVVSFSPPNLKSPSGQTYTVTGYINNQNLVTKVETRVDNAVVGDLLVEFEYSNYQNMNGVQVPTPHRPEAGRPARRSTRTITAATPNPAEPRPSCSRLRRLRPVAPAAPAGARGAVRSASRRPLRPSRSSATASSRSAATTPRSPSTWAITSSSSRAVRATRAAWR